MSPIVDLFYDNVLMNASESIAMSENLKEMHLKADGILCTGCAEDMEKILNDNEGILHASVSFRDNIIQVKYDPEIIDRKHVYMAVRRIAFPLKILSEK